MTSGQPDALAEIRLLPTADGGRENPMESGWRSLLRLLGTSADFGVQVDFVGTEIPPGEGRQVAIAIWARDALLPLKPGMRFDLREGTRIVGHGEIIAIPLEAVGSRSLLAVRIAFFGFELAGLVAILFGAFVLGVALLLSSAAVLLGWDAWCRRRYGLGGIGWLRPKAAEHRDGS